MGVEPWDLFFEMIDVKNEKLLTVQLESQQKPELLGGSHWRGLFNGLTDGQTMVRKIKKQHSSQSQNLKDRHGESPLTIPIDPTAHNPQKKN